MIILMRSTNLLTQDGLEDIPTNSSFQVGSAMKMHDPLIHEAVSTERAAGHPYLLTFTGRQGQAAFN